MTVEPAVAREASTHRYNSVAAPARLRPLHVIRVRSVEEAEVHVASLNVRVHELETEMVYLRELTDLLATPFWKRALFVIDGWPLTRIVTRPQWRPWRRWWTS